MRNFYESIEKIIYFISDHKKATLISFAALFLLIAISTIMTIKSVMYEPLEILYGSSTLNNEISIPYIKSVAYNESITVGSMVLGSITSLDGTLSIISDTVDIASRLEDVSGKSGVLTIPAKASVIATNGLGVYGWSKTYGLFFNQVDHIEITLVMIIGKYALSGKLGGDIGIFTGIQMYQLA